MCVHVIGKNTEQRVEFRTCVSVCACNRQEYRAVTGVQDICECVCM